MLQNDLLFLGQLLNPDAILFLIFGALLVLIFLLPIVPKIKTIIVLSVLLEVALVWKIFLGLLTPALHFVPEKFELLSTFFVWHHWFLLLPIPLLLVLPIMILSVYRERINEAHSVVYRRIVMFSVLASFVLFILSAIEEIF